MVWVLLWVELGCDGVLLCVDVGYSGVLLWVGEGYDGGISVGIGRLW